MFTVALIGPDGAGKTSVGRRLEAMLTPRVKYLYMGVNIEASNRALWTTRLVRAIQRGLGAKPDNGGPRDPDHNSPRPRHFAQRTLRAAKSTLGLLHRIGDEWFRQGVAWLYQRRGYIVVFDRHFFCDYHAYDIAASPTTNRPVTRRLHGSMLARWYPKPDLVIYLDAPAEVLFSRKREGTIELLERRRRDYLALSCAVKDFRVVNADQPADQVLDDVLAHILSFQRYLNDGVTWGNELPKTNHPGH